MICTVKVRHSGQTLNTGLYRVTVTKRDVVKSGTSQQKAQRHPRREVERLGWKVRGGETPEMCVRREVQEEAGLLIRNPHLHGLLMFPNFKGNDWYVFVFTATEFEGELLETSPEGHPEWVEDEELAQLNLWESDLIFFPWIEAGKFFSAKFDYEGEKMLGYDVNFH